MLLQKLARICLITLVATASIGCSQFPKLTVYKLVEAKGVCGEYQVASTNPVTFVFVKWHPISECDGYFSVSPSDTASIVAWCHSNPNICHY